MGSWTWWICESFQSPNKEPVQSRECEAYCEGRDDSRRAGHLEALREVEAVYYTSRYNHAPDCVRLARNRLARKRRMG